MSAKQDVVFFCWRCGQKLAVPDTSQGKSLPCPRCQRILTVPTGDEGAEKRDVPAPEPEAQADELTVTENDMTFNCEDCGWVLIMDKRGAGMVITCPGCGGLITAPQPQVAPTRKIGGDPHPGPESASPAQQSGA
jgi:DNA-directed RNA polymerase subunit RPC12/RpoP